MRRGWRQTQDAASVSPPMFLMASTTFLAVAADPEHDQERDGGRLAIEPDLDHGAIQDQPHDVLIAQIALLPGSQAARVLRQARLTASLVLGSSRP